MTFLLTTFAVLKRLPWWVYVGAVCAAALLWLVADDRHYRAKADALTLTLSQVKDAQAKATIAAQAAHDAQEQRYKDLANAADKDHAAALADAGTATSEYIRTHGVQQCPASRAASPATTASARGDTGIPASLPASGFVAVSDADVQACSDATVYAVEAHNHAIGLNP